MFLVVYAASEVALTQKPNNVYAFDEPVFTNTWAMFTSPIKDSL